MNGISLYNIYEQCYAHLQGKGEPQEVIRSVINQYAVLAKATFYQGRADELSPMNGSFFYNYKNIEVLKEDDYYVFTPSSYLLLPHEFGIKAIGFTGCKDDFWKIDNYNMWKGTKAGSFGGRQPYEVQENMFVFPAMKEADLLSGTTQKTIRVQLAIAMDDLDVDEPRNIAPDIVAGIVKLIIAEFNPQPEKVPDKIS